MTRNPNIQLGAVTDPIKVALLTEDPLMKAGLSSLLAQLGRAAGEATFHEVERLHGFSTMIESHARGAGAFGAGFTSRALPVTTLAAICEAHAPARIDVVKIDVEGAEADELGGGSAWLGHNGAGPEPESRAAELGGKRELQRVEITVHLGLEHALEQTADRADLDQPGHVGKAVDELVYEKNPSSSYPTSCPPFHENLPPRRWGVAACGPLVSPHF